MKDHFHDKFDEEGDDFWRPARLSVEQLQYAAEDVRSLVRLHQQMLDDVCKLTEDISAIGARWYIDAPVADSDTVPFGVDFRVVGLRPTPDQAGEDGHNTNNDNENETTLDTKVALDLVRVSDAPSEVVLPELSEEEKALFRAEFDLLLDVLPP